jgi:hypothetical protein
MIRDDALAREVAEALTQCPPLKPLARQRWILTQAIAWARQCGCMLPRFTVHWRSGRPEISGGCVVSQPGHRGPYQLFLNANADPADLRRTAAHELKHLSDFASGHTYSRLELERRAEAFASRVGLENFHVDALDVAPDTTAGAPDDDDLDAGDHPHHVDADAGGTRRALERAAAPVDGLLGRPGVAPWVSHSAAPLVTPPVSAATALRGLAGAVAHRRRRAIDQLRCDPVFRQIPDAAIDTFERFLAQEFGRLSREIDGRLMAAETHRPW